MAQGDEKAGRAKRGAGNIADAAEAIHDRIGHKVNARKTEHLASVLERFEADYAPHLAAILGDAAENPAIPEPLRALIAEVANPQHFTSSVLLGIALGAVITPVLSVASAPFIQLLANETWPKLPSVPLSPDALAAGVLKGVIEPDAASIEAKMSGYDGVRMGWLTDIAGQSMGAQEALLLLRRKQIDAAEFRRIIRYSNVRNDFIPDILKLMFAPPAAGTVIAGALKGWLTDADAKVKLGEAGIDPVNYDWLKDSSGRPPGTEQMLHLWNRGKATEADVEQATRQSDINDNYLKFVKELRWYVPPVRSILPMLRAGSITEAKATELFKENGVRTEDISLYLDEAKHTKAAQPKEITGAQVVRMYSARFIPRPDASVRLATIGYPAAEVTMLLDFADDTRKEKLLNALISKVGSAYVAHRIDKAEATADLDAGPVEKAAQTDLFHLWDLERSIVRTDKFQNAIIAKVQTLYVGHKIDKPTATASLTGEKVPTDLQADLFHLWDLERGMIVHHPSAPQVMHVYRQSLLTPEDTKARLVNLGVLPVDMAIVVASAYPPGATKEAYDAVVAITGKPPVGIDDPIEPEPT